MRQTSFIALAVAAFCACAAPKPLPSDQRFLISGRQARAGLRHLNHELLFGEHAPGFNLFVLKAIDSVQAKFPDGGGYFIGVKAEPPESPMGYALELFGKPLLAPPRKTSYCSGSSYTAFIEALNGFYAGKNPRLSPDRLEVMRMQEPDGGRREDGVKFWGWWNADGFGSQFALVQYSGMGEDIPPAKARPGDFMNISWKKGVGHSVVFLGWRETKKGKAVLFWSSQKASNGMADQLRDLDDIKEVKIVRVTHPEKLLELNPLAAVRTDVPGDQPGW